MAGFGQYLKDTRGELRHVAWPTQLQTIVYTALVILVSIVVALYLGFFDYMFTGALARYLSVQTDTSPIQIEQVEVVPAGESTQESDVSATE